MRAREGEWGPSDEGKRGLCTNTNALGLPSTK